MKTGFETKKKTVEAEVKKAFKQTLEEEGIISQGQANDWESKKLTHDQALKCLKKLNDGIDNEQLENAFNQADLDGDDQIELREVIEYQQE